MALDPGYLEIGSPSRLAEDPLQGGRGSSVTIGWFDNPPPALSTPVDQSGLKDPGVRGGAERDVGAEALLKRLAALLQPPMTLICDPEGILEWPSPLHPYQQAGVATLVNSRELLLADDMGLGKTIQAIGALRVLILQARIESALIVCPASLLQQWRRELSHWAPELTVVPVTGPPSDRAALWRLPSHANLVGYETLRGDVLDLRDSPVLRRIWGAVILDEASRIKNRDTGIARACKRLRTERRWALTGTPLENGLDDVISILEFLTTDHEGPPPRYGGIPEVLEHLGRLQLRRRKQDVLAELPPRLICEVEIELGPRQRMAYDEAERTGIVRLREHGASLRVTHVLELITRLKQLCNCDPATGESAKLDDIADRMEALAGSGHRALLFSQFTDQDFGVGLACRRLAAHRPLPYTGAMTAAQRSSTVDLFARNPDHRLLVLSLRAGGVGLNLQSASYVFHLDRWWNPAIEEQADSRAHRMGQPYPVHVFRYVCTGTIEERIAETLRRKRQLFGDVVDEVSLDLRETLTEEELFGLFGLEGPRRKTPPVGEGPEFEAWLAACLRTRGYEVDQTPASRDGGVDLVAVRREPPNLDVRLLIQCKNQRQPVGVAAVRELRGAVPERMVATTPVLASPSGFSREASTFAQNNGVQLWGPEDLKELSRTVQPGAMPDITESQERR